MNNLSHKIMSDVTVFQKYAKFLEEFNRREDWGEGCRRNRGMHIKRYPFLREEIIEVYNKFVIPKKDLPSMRSMQFAGKPIELNHARIYNCCFFPVDSWKAFPELMFLLLGGTGAGYSVQRNHIDKLPSIRKPTKRRRFVISDDIVGWAEAIKALIRAYLDGKYLPEFEYGDIRKKGTLLKTSGGKAPGPGPLKECLDKIKRLLEEKQNGERLNSLEVHDICCHIADAVLAGGIRRAAMIALFNIDDELMLKCKSNFKVNVLEEVPFNGAHYQVRVQTIWNEKEHNLIISRDDHQKMGETGRLPWWYFEPQRGRSNNSAVFIRHKVKKKDFNKFWKMIEENKSGEPGIYFSNNADWGTNPCVEIALRPFQFCNLTETNVSNITTQKELNDRVKAAAFLGTLQSGYTDFHYLRDVWKETTERDALLGVSLTGIAGIDYKQFDWTEAANIALAENWRVADIIGVKRAARVTCVKPAGTTSLVLGSSSGIHAWFYKYYIRRMTINKEENIYKYLKKNIPQLIEDNKINPTREAFITIPMAAPKDALIMPDESALDFLERVKYFSNNWIQPGHLKGDNTHNVSATVNVRENDWESVGSWMWENRNSFNGLSVIPFDGGTYSQAPHEEITKKKFEELSEFLTGIDLTKVVEERDNTSRAQEIACAGGICDIQL